ncbi:hypothetical protein EK904_009042 [Melospiza melodia maxima]|nr:hypothetical protein EK904_009042 [Melospiza melodia maxima]
MQLFLCRGLGLWLLLRGWFFVFVFLLSNRLIFMRLCPESLCCQEAVYDGKRPAMSPCHGTPCCLWSQFQQLLFYVQSTHLLAKRGFENVGYNM